MLLPKFDICFGVFSHQDIPITGVFKTLKVFVVFHDAFRPRKEETFLVNGQYVLSM